jgi:hypothetical protein
MNFLPTPLRTRRSEDARCDAKPTACWLLRSAGVGTLMLSCRSCCKKSTKMNSSAQYAKGNYCQYGLIFMCSHTIIYGGMQALRKARATESPRQAPAQRGVHLQGRGTAFHAFSYASPSCACYCWMKYGETHSLLTATQCKRRIPAVQRLQPDSCSPWQQYQATAASQHAK